MGKANRSRPRWAIGGLFLCTFIPVCSGCNRQDTERLARVGRKVAAKAEALAGNEANQLTRGMDAVRAALDQTALDARVSARLRWDKALADADIRVRCEGGQVKLKGTVKDLAQRRRAVELAESTAGVETIIDALEVPAEGR